MYTKGIFLKKVSDLKNNQPTQHQYHHQKKKTNNKKTPQNQQIKHPQKQTHNILGTSFV